MPFRELNSNEQGLIGVGLDITEKCNRRCPTCFARHSPQDMSVHVFEEIVTQAAELRFTELYILGGEPGLRRDLISLINRAVGKINTIILVTNVDFLANEETCRKIAETGVVVAGQRHTIKNDAESHEIERILTGDGHFETSLSGWKNISKYFPPERVCVQCCITRPVVESGSIFEVFRWVRQMGYEPVMEFTKEGGGFKRGCNMDISSQEMMTVLEEFQRIDREEFGLPGAKLLSPQAYGKTCHMLETSIHFLVDGTAIPCVGHHDISYGHILNDGIKSILEHPLRQAIMNPEKWIYGYCRDECPHFEKCTGGCRGSSLDMTGCPRASFYYCPHIPEELALQDMIPPNCAGCPLEGHPACQPKRD